jgi:hypothetical protein
MNSEQAQSRISRISVNLRIIRLLPQINRIATEYFTAKAQRAQRFFVFWFFPETGKNQNQPALRGLLGIFCSAY